MDDSQFKDIENDLHNVLSSLSNAFDRIKEPNGGLNEVKSAVNSLKNVQETLLAIYSENEVKNSISKEHGIGDD